MEYAEQVIDTNEKETCVNDNESPKSESTESKESYFERIPIDNTPFDIIKVKEKYTIAIGNILMTEKQFETEREAKVYVAEKPWELLISMIAIYTKWYKDQIENLINQKK